MAGVDHGQGHHPGQAKEANKQEAVEGGDVQAAGNEDETERRMGALDPDVRRSLELGPPPFVGMISPQATPVAIEAPGNQPKADHHARATLDELLPLLVQKIAWTGNGQRGSVRMELGAGKLAGGTILVHADDGKVRVEVSAPSGADPVEWRKRIDARLREHGLDVDSVEVT